MNAEYKNYIIEKRNNIWIILDDEGSQICDHMGCELTFESLNEAKAYIDENLS